MMGNMDMQSSVKDLEYESITPLTTFKDGVNTCPLSYEYPILNNLSGTKEIVMAAMTQEMSDYLKSAGYELFDPQSIEARNVLDTLNRNANILLGQSSVGEKGLARVDIGTPFVVEREDKADRRKKINVVLGVVKVNKSSRPDNEFVYIFAHPVEMDGQGNIQLSNQHRSDEPRTFSPPLWFIEPEHPFGYHSNFPQILSYPIVDGNNDYQKILKEKQTVVSRLKDLFKPKSSQK